MSARPFILAETTWHEVRQAQFEVAILPWGATEAHNYHLPYGTDNIQLDFIAAEAARKAWERKARVVVLPTMPFGVNTGQLDITLDVNMMPSTQALVLQDVANCLGHQGIRKLLLLNGHGGNDFKQMIRETGARVPELSICTMNWFRAMNTRAYFDEPGDHAGELETSTLLHIAPHLVRPLSEAGTGAARPFRMDALRSGWVWAERPWLEVTEDTGVGNPALATPEKGRIFLEALTDKMATFLVELDACNLDDMFL